MKCFDLVVSYCTGGLWWYVRTLWQCELHGIEFNDVMYHLRRAALHLHLHHGCQHPRLCSLCDDAVWLPSLLRCSEQDLHSCDVSPKVQCPLFEVLLPLCSML